MPNTVPAAAEGLPAINRRHAFVATGTALATMFAGMPASSPAVAEELITEAPGTRARRLAAELAETLNDHLDGEFFAVVYPSVAKASPVTFYAIGSEPSPAVAAAVERYHETVAALNTAYAALGDTFEEAPEREADEAYLAAHDAFTALLAVPCVTLADIKAKVTVFAEASPALGSELEYGESRALLRSFAEARS